MQRAALLLKGDLSNLAKVIKNGAHGKLRTVNAPNCPGLLHAFVLQRPFGSQDKNQTFQDENQVRNCLFRVAGFSAAFWLGSPPVPPPLACPTRNRFAREIQRLLHYPVATWKAVPTVARHQ